MSEKNVKRHWLAIALGPPSLPGRYWPLSNLVGIIFIVAALTQLASLNSFENNLAANGIGWTAFVAAVLIIAELWAAAGFFKLGLSRLFRAVSNFFALAVSGFWFFETLRQVSESGESSYIVNGTVFKLNSNFFGNYLIQKPGWWTVAEITIFFFLVIFLLENLRVNASIERSSK